jgi:hypothetical protein
VYNKVLPRRLATHWLVVWIAPMLHLQAGLV